MFEFLFKYRPLLFERGELTLALPWWALAAAVVAVAVAVPTILRYRRLGRELLPVDRVALAALRTAALAIVLFCLFRPVLLISTVVPQRNFVAVLMDDSRSMRIADVEGRPRGELIANLFGRGGSGDEPEGKLLGGLEDRFRVRFYGFGSTASPVSGPADLSFGAGRTSLAAAIERAEQELEGLPLAGLVLVTDGADNSERSLTEPLLSLRSAGIPVYAVGLGSERISPDVELRRVELPRSTLLGSTLVADAIVSHAGFSGRTVRLDVEDAGRIIGTQEVELIADGEVPVQVQLTVEETGPRRLAFRLRPLDGEAVTRNNAREVLLDVRDRRVKILYFEGEPRFEIKFLRRAVAEDPNLQVVLLLRTADEKFLRLDVDDGEELTAGFPRTREELYSYSGLVLGSVEASFFTHDQLQMMADFVSQRGGGLLTLGGARAFAEGGYAGTPLADALPVVLEPTGEQIAELTVELTPAGRRHPALRIAEEEQLSADRWSTLPPVTAVNFVRRVKPGAVTLLNGRVTGGGEPRVVLALQRYGAGTSMTFPIQDSWLWQMHADIAVDDPTHERLWRQLLRSLVADVPGRVRVTLSEETLDPGDILTLTATVDDERHLRLNGAEVVASVTSPTGAVEELPMEWTVDRDGEYSVRLRPEEPGLYDVRVALGSEAAAPEPGHVFFQVGDTEREQFESAMRAPLLRRIADETGGRFYTPDDVETLPEDIRYTEAGNTMIERRELWDMPILLLLLVGLVGAEWGYRRWRELP